jgi:hypothetical protein
MVGSPWGPAANTALIAEHETRANFSPAGTPTTLRRAAASGVA